MCSGGGKASNTTSTKTTTITIAPQTTQVGNLGFTGDNAVALAGVISKTMGDMGANSNAALDSYLQTANQALGYVGAVKNAADSGGLVDLSGGADGGAKVQTTATAVLPLALLAVVAYFIIRNRK